eukprot:ANDGO_01563.mRNA.1 Transmembrane emp24 domain-containing protein A
MGRYTVVALLSAVCLSCVVVSVSGLAVTVDAHAEQCFFETMKRDAKTGVYFQVTAGGFLDIDVLVTGPDQRLLHKVERETEGRFTFAAYDGGAYKICFSNKMSTLTPKQVVFQILPGGRAEFAEFAKLEHMSPIEESLLRLADGLSDVQSEQRYLRNRERVHRNTAESTQSRVTFWSFFETFVLIGMSIWQVWYITRYFEVKNDFRQRV